MQCSTCRFSLCERLVWAGQDLLTKSWKPKRKHILIYGCWSMYAGLRPGIKSQAWYFAFYGTRRPHFKHPVPERVPLWSLEYTETYTGRTQLMYLDCFFVFGRALLLLLSMLTSWRSVFKYRSLGDPLAQKRTALIEWLTDRLAW